MKNLSYWLDVPYDPRPSLETDISVDVVVIGGGITGISVAYHCVKAGFKTALIEKNVIGSGSGGKNGGMVVEGMEIDFYVAQELFGLKKAKEIWNTTVLAKELIYSIIDENSIDCDFEKTGSLYVGSSEEERLKIDKEIKARDGAGIKFEIINKDQLPKSSSFVKAIYNSTDALLNPVKFIRELAMTAEKHGLLIYEDTNAVSFNTNSVKTDRGTVSANKVVVAIESNSQNISKNTAMFRSQAIVTEPLSENKIKEMDWDKGGMLWPTDDEYITCRKIENRLFSCLDVSLQATEKDLQKNRESQVNKIVSFFPTLTKDDLNISHCWTGLILSTKDYRSYITSKNGYYEIYGHSGLGLTNGIMTGKVLADHFAGKDIPDVYKEPQKPYLEP